MGKVVESVTELVTPIAEGMGLEVVEVTYKKCYDGMNLTVAIDQPLDELAPIECAYTLNVSSPGIDRPLTLPRDYKRNLDKDISVRLYKPLDGKKIYEGTLTAYDDETFTIVTAKGKEITFNKKDAAKVEPIIVF